MPATVNLSVTFSLLLPPYGVPLAVSLMALKASPFVGTTRTYLVGSEEMMEVKGRRCWRWTSLRAAKGSGRPRRRSSLEEEAAPKSDRRISDDDVILFYKFLKSEI